MLAAATHSPSLLATNPTYAAKIAQAGGVEATLSSIQMHSEIDVSGLAERTALIVQRSADVPSPNLCPVSGVQNSSQV